MGNKKIKSKVYVRIPKRGITIKPNELRLKAAQSIILSVQLYFDKMSVCVTE